MATSQSSPAATAKLLLAELKKAMDRTTLTIIPVTAGHYTGEDSGSSNDYSGGHNGRVMLPYTVLFRGLRTLNWNPQKCADVVHASCAGNAVLDRACGALMGLALGDAVGGPLEFIPVDSSLPPYVVKKTRKEQGRLAFLDPVNLLTTPDDKQQCATGGAGQPQAQPERLAAATSSSSVGAGQQATSLSGGASASSDQSLNREISGSSVAEMAATTAVRSGIGFLHYAEEYNKFNLKRGQWTDDASMAFALAESMMCHGSYNGSDVRVRYYLWWYFGYCNAFRFDQDSSRTSVGLGGNISKSIDDLIRFSGQNYKAVPPNFEAHGEDAGNGSIMRLAPVPIRYLHDIQLAMDTSEQSSYATHPGPDAAACCRFVSFFIVKAIHRVEAATSTTPLPSGVAGGQNQNKANNLPSASSHSSSTSSGSSSSASLAAGGGSTEELLLDSQRTQTWTQLQSSVDGLAEAVASGATVPANPIATFLDEVIEEFISLHRTRCEKGDTGLAKLFQLLQCAPPSEKEACWNWKLERLPLEETIKARGRRYNGYPVMSGYFGSYVMDGLAMSLWALSKSFDFVDCILKVVNLLGDCDTTGAIAGQMAGAFYGYSSLSQTTFGLRFLADIRQWDPLFEIELRALILAEDALADQAKKTSRWGC